jgi:hypothetical protein
MSHPATLGFPSQTQTYIMSGWPVKGLPGMKAVWLLDPGEWMGSTHPDGIFIILEGWTIQQNRHRSIEGIVESITLVCMSEELIRHPQNRHVGCSTQ